MMPCIQFKGFSPQTNILLKIVQWRNLVNTDTKETCHTGPYYLGVNIKRALRENIRDTCFINIKTKADSSKGKCCLIS